MIILDASAVVEMLMGSRAGGRVTDRIQAEAAPPRSIALLDLEVANTLRRLVRLGELDAQRAGGALTDLAALALVRFPHTPFLSRIWELRDRLTAYDAAYVALAEELGAPLLTLDARLARAGGHRAQVELIEA
ncbi:MAG: type II toxin-antitoxin system VapC family toxin [Gemmatimonadales bacterium]